MGWDRMEDWIDFLRPSRMKGLDGMNGMDWDGRLSWCVHGTDRPCLLGVGSGTDGGDGDGDGDGARDDSEFESQGGRGFCGGRGG